VDLTRGGETARLKNFEAEAGGAFIAVSFASAGFGEKKIILQEADMKKSVFWCVCFLTAVLSVSAVYGQGFTGPGSGTTTGQAQTVTVLQARSLPDNSLVILTGAIVQSLGREKYTFRDSTGDITIDVDRDLWTLLGLSISPSDRVEIGGKIDVEKRAVEIDVKYLKKL
jgi:uncharacterized protein (TIGR00156 family)